MKPSPKYTPFFIFFTLFFFSSYLHTQAQDSCTSPLNLQNPLPFDTSSLNCAAVWSAHNYILRYVQTTPNIWNFILSAPNTNQYIGIGFSPNGNMIGSRAIVGWVGSNGTLEMRKYFLGGQSSNLVTVETFDQGLQIANTTLVLQSNQIYMAFQLTSTATPTTHLIYSLGHQSRLPSGPDYRLSEHQERISTDINYATGQFQSQSGRPQASLRRTHGLLNMLGWGILIPIGAMVARYMRQWDPIWFYSHTIIQTFGFVLGVSGVICGLVLENRLRVSVSNHKGLGIFILILGCLQVIAFLLRPGKESKVRRYWNWYHFSVGRLLIFFAAINVFYGIHLGRAGREWNISFAIVIFIFFLTSVVLELKMYFKK